MCGTNNEHDAGGRTYLWSVYACVYNFLETEDTNAKRVLTASVLKWNILLDTVRVCARGDLRYGSVDTSNDGAVSARRTTGRHTLANDTDWEDDGTTMTPPPPPPTEPPRCARAYVTSLLVTVQTYRVVFWFFWKCLLYNITYTNKYVLPRQLIRMTINSIRPNDGTVPVTPPVVRFGNYAYTKRDGSTNNKYTNKPAG